MAKKKNKPLSIREQMNREDSRIEDSIVVRRIQQREESYDSQFKGDIERIYREYIVSRYWTDRKILYFGIHKKECALCRSKTSVELNHIYYGNFGFEKDEDLIPLCRQHHEELHKHIGVKKDMRYATGDFIEMYRNQIAKEGL